MTIYTFNNINTWRKQLIDTMTPELSEDNASEVFRVLVENFSNFSTRKPSQIRGKIHAISKNLLEKMGLKSGILALCIQGRIIRSLENLSRS